MGGKEPACPLEARRPQSWLRHVGGIARRAGLLEGDTVDVAAGGLGIVLLGGRIAGGVCRWGGDPGGSSIALTVSLGAEGAVR